MWDTAAETSMEPRETRLLDLAIHRGWLQPGEVGEGQGLGDLARAGRLTVAQLDSLAEADPSLALTVAEREAWSSPAGTLDRFDGWEKYEVLRFHAEGGMGRIYKARDRQLGRTVALKFIAHAHEAAARRFAQEAQVQARVQHEAVCQVFEVGEWRNEPYIAMQFIDGRPLNECLGRLGLEEKVELMRKVAEGLHAAHRLGLIHRDVKTGNIMVEQGPDGGWRPYVVDFGLARAQESPTMTQTGLIVGTPAYMSPEQARGDTSKVDRRSDVYALGATLYEVLTGKLPFRAASAVDILVAVLSEDPVPPRAVEASLPPDLEAIILKCLEKEPARRYDSTLAVAEDLQRFLDGEPVKARQIGAFQRLWRKVRRHPVAASLIAASAVLSLGFGAWGARTAWKARALAALAQRYGQEVEQIDAILRFGHLLPLHDLAREKAIVRARMERIAAEMGALGQTGRGPGHAALGRGHLALREWAAARRELEAAWELGQRDPGSARALGLALASLYQKDLEEVRRIKDPAQRARRKQAISTALRDRALACLKAGNAAAEDAAYVQGIIALQEEHYDEALARAREAQGAQPWRYEANALEGEILLARAGERFERGAYAEALAGAAESAAAYARALPIARSDDALRLGIAQALLLEATIRVDQGRSTAAPFEQAMAQLREARRADPARPETHALEARINWMRAFDLGNTGGDPRAHLQASIRAGEEAIRLGSTDIRTYDNLATTYWFLAQQEASRGGDGEAPLAAAMDVLARGRRLDPADPFLYRNLGVIHGIRAELCFRKGADPGPDLATSADSFRRAIALDPGFMQAHFNLGNTLTMQAMLKAERGQDPAPELAQADATLAKAIELNPACADCWDQRGVARNLAAAFQFEGGRDPGPDLEQALSHFREALARNPNAPQTLVHRAEALLLRTRVLRGNPDAARAALAEALQACREARRIDPDYGEIAATYVDTLGLEAQLQADAGRPVAVPLAEARKALAAALARDPRMQALWERRARLELLALELGAAPEPALETAAKALAQAAALGSPSATGWTLRARLQAARAEQAHRRGGDPSRFLAEGRQLLERALNSNPRQADAVALQGRLAVVAALAAGDPLRRRAEGKAARGLLAEAGARNPHLARDWQPWLAAAERLERR